MATQFKEDKWILLFERCPEDFTTARCHGKEAFNLHKEQRQNMHQAFPILKELLVVRYISVKNVP